MEVWDIIIYAAIAAFLLTRLWSVLGQRGEDEEDASGRPDPFSNGDERETDEEDVVIIEGRSRLENSGILTDAGHAPASLAGAIDQIKLYDTAFDERGFIEGAKIAFRDIVGAFAKGDLSPVAWLLGHDVKKLFEQVIQQRRQKGQHLENIIERIAAADIVEAKVEDGVAELTVEFVSFQVNRLIENEQAEETTKERPEEVRDLWTFRRDTKSPDPNWLLVETRS